MADFSRRRGRLASWRLTKALADRQHDGAMFVWLGGVAEALGAGGGPSDLWLDRLTQCRICWTGPCLASPDGLRVLNLYGPGVEVLLETLDFLKDGSETPTQGRKMVLYFDRRFLAVNHAPDEPVAEELAQALIHNLGRQPGTPAQQRTGSFGPFSQEAQ